MAFIRGSNNNDNLSGTSLSDFIFGMSGDDFIFGGDGNDIIFGGVGYDVLDGGNGNDTIIDLHLVRHTVANGGNGDDTIRIGFGTANGGAGDDELRGEDAVVFNGGAGADDIYAGRMNNLEDKFVYDSVTDSNSAAYDEIYNFETKNDVIEIDNSIATHYSQLEFTIVGNSTIIEASNNSFTLQVDTINLNSTNFEFS